jgi:hypothetical protein
MRGPRADAGPESGGGRLRRALLRPAGPEDPPANGDQQRGQQGQHDGEADQDADGGHRAEALGRVGHREEQAEHADHDGRAAREDRRAGAVQGDRHRLVPVVVPAQLLAVAGDEQQRVVGARPEDQDGQDAGALRVDDQAGVLGQQVDDRLGDGERDTRRDDRQDPQHRAAVGEQQDDHDHRDRAEQQRAVDALERLGRVGGETRRAGDVRVEPLRAGRRGVGHGRHLVGGLVPTVRTQIERYEDLGGPPVGGGHRTDHLAVEAGIPGEHRGVGPDLLQVGRRQAGRPFVDDDRRDGVRRRERGLPVQRLGGLRAARQPGARVVLLRAGQLPGQRRGDRDHDEPEQQHDVLDPAVRDHVDDGPHHDPPMPRRSLRAYPQKGPWSGRIARRPGRARR